MGDPADPGPGSQGKDSNRGPKAQSGANQELSDVQERLEALDAKLDAHRPDPVLEKQAKQDRSQWSMAMRVSSDFIAAVFVGGLLGWGLDEVAGTGPFGLIVLLLLGFAAGVLNVMRTLGLIAQPRPLRARRDDTVNSDRDGR
ncbi:MAG: AtpZ/AtpI family protein [Pseudomonadota bacterium]